MYRFLNTLVLTFLCQLNGYLRRRRREESQTSPDFAGVARLRARQGRVAPNPGVRPPPGAATTSLPARSKARSPSGSCLAGSFPIQCQFMGIRTDSDSYGRILTHPPRPFLIPLSPPAGREPERGVRSFDGGGVMRPTATRRWVSACKTSARIYTSSCLPSKPALAQSAAQKPVWILTMTRLIPTAA